MCPTKLFKTERKVSCGPRENGKEIDHLLKEEIRSKLEMCNERSNMKQISKHQLCKIMPTKYRDLEKNKSQHFIHHCLCVRSHLKTEKYFFLDMRKI